MNYETKTAVPLKPSHHELYKLKMPISLLLENKYHRSWKLHAITG